MNASDLRLLDQIGLNADELEKIEKLAAIARKKRLALFERARKARIETAEIAAYARIQPVTVRQILRRAGIENE